MGPRKPSAELMSEVIDVVLNAANLQHLDRSTLAQETTLAQGGLELDSIDILEIVIAVESHFGVKVESAEEGKLFFKSIGTIGEFVASKRN